MKLVIVIDRDNDLGEKAGVSSPVVGRENVLNASLKLGIADPEDSDVNAMLAGVKVCDEVSKHEECDVVVVCGDKKVGTVSDKKIAQQLDEIAETIKPESVLVVTDGSEDEFILPLIYSRFKVDSVQRVVVKQSKTIESTYFMIRRMLNDPKIAKITLAPIGMIFLVYSLALLFRYPELGIGGIILFLGVYFLAKAYGWDRSVENYAAAIKRSFVEGRVSFVLYLTSAILLIVGIIQGINAAIVEEDYRIFTIFILHGIAWFTLSGLLLTFARAADSYAEGRSTRKYYSITFLILSCSIILWSSARFLINFDLRELALAFFLAMIIAFAGFYVFKQQRSS